MSEGRAGATDPPAPEARVAHGAVMGRRRDELAASAGEKPRLELTTRAVCVAVVVAALMGAAEPVVVLKIGYGPNMSVVSAFLGFIALSLIGLVTRIRGTRWETNLVQAAGGRPRHRRRDLRLLHGGPPDVRLDPGDAELHLPHAARRGAQARHGDRRALARRGALDRRPRLPLDAARHHPRLGDRSGAALPRGPGAFAHVQRGPAALDHVARDRLAG